MMRKCENIHLKYESNRDTWIDGYETEFENEEKVPILYFVGWITFEDESLYRMEYCIDKNTVEYIKENL